jgi:hypothetical protein
MMGLSNPRTQTMFSRAVSIATIFAIVACPLWCGSGICQAGCCALQSDSHGRKGASEADCDCCCDSAKQSHRRPCDESPQPCDSPPNSSCQGVCGGAVIGKSSELDENSTSTIACAVAGFDQVWPQQLPSLNDFARSGQSPIRGKNPGRVLRTRYMSFLC